jgi:hypothetical protein
MQDEDDIVVNGGISCLEKTLRNNRGTDELVGATFAIEDSSVAGSWYDRSYSKTLDL